MATVLRGPLITGIYNPISGGKVEYNSGCKIEGPFRVQYDHERIGKGEYEWVERNDVGA